MADEKNDTDGEVEEVEGKAKKKRPWLLLGVIGVLVLVLLGGATVGGLYYAGMFDPQENSEKKNPDEEGSDEEADSEEDAEDDSEGEAEGAGEGEDAPQAAIYIPIESTFVVNFEGVSRIRFLQVTVEMMTRNALLADSVKTHMPVIRNNLTFLFSSRTYEDVSTIEGKEQLRSDALKEVQKILEAEVGDPVIEALYFTSFVTQ